MKAPLVVVIVIVLAILGFLVVYSQQHDMPAQTVQEHVAGAPSSAPAPAGTEQSSGSTNTAGGSTAPAEGHGQAPSGQGAK